MVLGTNGFLGLALQLAGATAPAGATESALKIARAAQQRFESTRRVHLPRLRSSGGRECDAVIGRFCYWYDSTGTKPAPEPQRIVAARKHLVALLDSLAALHPENDWLQGQLVRYTIEGSDSPDDPHAARPCRATPWWCAALGGLILHVSERYGEADSAFARAIELMPDEQRCEWFDLRRHVAYSMTGELRKGTCSERAAKAQRLWQISQPLWSVRGNDLRTEHFARHTMALILARSANPHGMPWSSDNRELLLRYGWSEWFSRAEPSPYQTTPGSVTGHDREPSYFVFPTTASPAAAIDASSWAFRDATMPMRYAPRHIEWMGDLSHQLVRLPRGDSLRLVAIAQPRDGALASDSVRWFLGALRSAVVVSVTTVTMPLMLDLPNDSALVSIEAFGARSHRAERARYTIGPLPCQRRCISDLLLYRADGLGDSATLALAAGRGFAGRAVAGAHPVGVYWEIGGPSRAVARRDSVVWSSISVEPERVGAVRRIAARLRLAATPTALKLRWRMQLAPNGNVVLRLPANARGRYRVTLSIEGVGTSQRVVVIE